MILRKFVFYCLFYCLLTTCIAQDLPDNRYFVVDVSWTDDLFSVRDETNNFSDRFSIHTPINGNNLQIDINTGNVKIISKWNSVTERVESFRINITRSGIFVKLQTVNIKLVNRVSVTNPILLKNEPLPLKATVFTWTRPDTIVLKCIAIDSDFHKDNKLIYELADDGRGRFGIDSHGNIFVKKREMFSGLYRLAVTMYSKGTLNRSSKPTPVQPISIKSGSMAPQFFNEFYDINFNEKLQINSKIATIKVKSFQNLRIDVIATLLDNNVFQLIFENNENGISSYAILIKKSIIYGEVGIPYIFNFALKATEQISSLTTSVSGILRLVDVNEAPFFTVDRYELTQVETITDLQLTAYDMDMGKLSTIKWSIDDNINFELTNAQSGSLQKRSRSVTIRANGQLNYNNSPDHTYNVLATATDGGTPPLNASIVVVYRIKQVALQAPVMNPKTQEIKISREASLNTDIYFIQANRPDGLIDVNNKLEFWLNSFTDLFKVNVTTGAISLKKQLPTTTASYDVKVIIKAGLSTNNDAGTLRINLVNINKPPVFTKCKDYMASSINENKESGTVILTVLATDTDPGEAGKVTYSIVKNEASDFYYFNINPNNGAVNNTVKFDRENPPNGRTSLRLTVKATDAGKPSQSTNCFFFVKILDENDETPQFDGTLEKDKPVYSSYIPPNLANNGFIAQVFAYDKDELDSNNALLDYEIETVNPACSNCFKLEQDDINTYKSLRTAILRKNSELPSTLTTYSVTVKATDRGTNNKKSSSATITVIITDSSSDYSPSITEIDKFLKIIEIDETFKPGQAIISGTATNHESNLLYTITEGPTPLQNNPIMFGTFDNGAGKFDIQFLVGKPKLDREKQPKYSLKLVITGKQSLIIRVTLVLIDKNNKVPEFQGVDESGNYRIFVPQNTPDKSETLSFIATDDDSSFNNNNKVSYTIISCVIGGLQSPQSNCIDTFIVKVEKKNEYYFGSLILNKQLDSTFVGKVLTIDMKAEDGSNSAIDGQETLPNQSKKKIRIDITGFSSDSPKFPQSEYQLSIKELSAIDTSIATIRATATDPTHDQFIEKSYSIKYPGNEFRWFSVDSQTGKLFVATNGLIDIDKLPSISKIIQLNYIVFDSAIVAHETILKITIIDINKFPPRIETNNFVYKEYTEGVIPSANGLSVLQFKMIDPDVKRSQRIGYQDRFVSLSGRWKDKFRVEKRDNDNAELFLIDKLERDFINGYDRWEVTVIVNDENQQSTRKTGYGVFIIEPKDVNTKKPQFNIDCSLLSVNESSKTNTIVKDLSTCTYDTDFATNSNINVNTYEIRGTDMFRIVNGRLEVSKNIPIRYENQFDTTQYTFEVKVNDSGTPVQISNWISITVKVTDINNHVPKFENSSIQINMDEELPIGSVVYTLYANDLDVDKNAFRDYTTISDDFYMDSLYAQGGGAIRVKRRINYEALLSKFINFQVSVRNPGPISTTSSIDVRIDVLDINDNKPEIRSNSGTSSLTIPENVDVGTNRILETFTANDIDAGIAGQFDWLIDYENSDMERRFALFVDANQPSQAKLFASRQLDYERKKEYNLKILAVDKGQPPQIGSFTYTIKLTDINDNAPYVIVDRMLVVKKSTSIDSRLDGVLTVVDDDLPENGPQFDMKIGICGNSNSACNDFKINWDSSGKRGYVLSSKTTYDRLSMPVYYLPVIVNDNPTSGQASKSGTSTLTIHVEGTNSNSQEGGITKTVTVFNYKYELKDSSIAIISSIDKDDWDREDKTFELLNNKDEFYVVSDRNDPFHGHVKIREGVRDGTYDLGIRITDTTRSNDVATSKLIVNVVYIDDDVSKNTASMTIASLKAEEFLNAKDNEKSPKEKLQESLAAILQTNKNNVNILTAYDSPKGLNVQYAAHGSPYYDKSKLDSLAIENKNKLQSDTGVTISQLPINECQNDDAICYTGGCVTTVDLDASKTLVINTNKTSLAGLLAISKKQCICKSQEIQVYDKCDVNFCLNNGTCIDKYTDPSTYWGSPKCECLPGFEGPRCQLLDRSFDGNSWVWYEKLELCKDNTISLDILPTSKNSLIFYQGPLTNDNAQDFMALELINGRVKFTLKIDGKTISLQVNGASLDDGKWHNILISRMVTIRKFVEWSLVIDNCRDATVTESISSSEENNNVCRQATIVDTVKINLNTNGPLQLGGRKDTTFPNALSKIGFSGCLKNLRHNSQLKDLYVGKIRISRGNTVDGCPSVKNKCVGCPSNSTCVADLTSAAVKCVCNPGFSGSDCSTNTGSKMLGNQAYLSWALKSLNSTISTTKSRRNQRLQLQFRTRKTTGIIFTSSSFSTLERIILRLSNSNLQLQYDLGSGFNTLRLNRKVNDGLWHTVIVERFGNAATLQLDGGDGEEYFVRKLMDDSHRLIAFSGNLIASGALLERREYVNEPLANELLENSCIRDVRFEWDEMKTNFPIQETANNDLMSLTTKNTVDGCKPADACATPNLCVKATCVDIWQSFSCDCGYGFNYIQNSCSMVSTCIVPQCYNGGVCAVFNDKWICYCSEEYSGDRCQTKVAATLTKEPKVTVSSGVIAAIVISILVVLVILLIVAILVSRRNPKKVIIDHPETEEREFCYNYSEEGGGEQDTANFSTAELRKAVQANGFMPSNVKKQSVVNLGYQPDSIYDRKPGGSLQDFLGGRLQQADDDPTAPPYDTVREYEFEGNASQVSSLSSLASGSTDASIDYEPYMQGPRFEKLRDIYENNDYYDNENDISTA